MESGLHYLEPQFCDTSVDVTTKEGSFDESSDMDMRAEDEQNFTLFNGKPYEDLTFQDMEKVQFNSIEEVDILYKYYSLAKGFDMRKRKHDKNCSGNITRRQVVCSKQGETRKPKKVSLEDSVQRNSKEEKKENLHTKEKPRTTKKRRITRFNCPAILTVRRCTNTRVYYVVEFITEHNHPLTKLEHRHFLKSWCHVSDYNLAVVNTLRKVSLKTCRAYEFLVHQAGGHEFVGFTIKDLYNKRQGE